MARVQLPPHKQRRLNARIREQFQDLYDDWYDMARSMQIDGATYEQIAERFRTMGVPISVFTVHNWMKRREAA
jgi:hypothetical protein